MIGKVDLFPMVSSGSDEDEFIYNRRKRIYIDYGQQEKEVKRNIERQTSLPILSTY